MTTTPTFPGTASPHFSTCPLCGGRVRVTRRVDELREVLLDPETGTRHVCPAAPAPPPAAIPARKTAKTPAKKRPKRR